MAVKGVNTTKKALDWDRLMKIARKEMVEGNRELGLYIVISLYTGMRMNEILKLRLSQFYDEQGSIKEYLDIHQSKTGKSRRIKVADGLKQVLGSFDRDGGYVVRNRRNRSVSKQYLNTVLKQTGERYGMDRDELSSHALRKTFARRVIEKNPGKEEWALILLSDIFGHSSVAITRRYLGLRQEELDLAYNSL